MRTTSADKFIDYVQNLEIDTRMTRPPIPLSAPPQAGVRDQVHQDRTPSDTENEPRDYSTRTQAGNSSIMVGEGDFLQPERIQNGIVFNVVRKDAMTPSNRSHDSEHNSSGYDSVAAECVQIECPDKEIDASSASENGDDNTEDVHVDEVDDSGSVPIARSDDDVRDKHVMNG